MSNSFGRIAFTRSVRAVQEAMGSAQHYADSDVGTPALGPDEVAFIGARDSFYMASVGETGWPYVQHRGGPPGFLKTLGEMRIGFADFRGNRQYVSTGNLLTDDRVALILVDYPHRMRLKILGHARVVSLDQTEILEKLQTPGYRARVERGFVIEVAAFDWNCPQHIVPRFSKAELEPTISAFQARIAELERALGKRGGNSPTDG